MFYYGGNLPHWHPSGHVLFVTARLHGSVPLEVIEQLHIESQQAARTASASDATPTTDAVWRAAARRCFALLEQHLEHGDTGPDWLRHPEIQQTVLDALHHQHEHGRYELLAACVMPNHLHTVLRLPADASAPFAQVWADFKRFTARRANQALHRTNHFWQSESYDHVLRDGDEGLGKAIRYTAQNPVKARLCRDWQAWPGTWVTKEWQEVVGD